MTCLFSINPSGFGLWMMVLSISWIASPSARNDGLVLFFLATCGGFSVGWSEAKPVRCGSDVPPHAPRIIQEGEEADVLELLRKLRMLVRGLFIVCIVTYPLCKSYPSSKSEISILPQGEDIKFLRGKPYFVTSKAFGNLHFL